MTIRIKALNEQEFSEAATGGYVYGKFSSYVGTSYRTIYVYVENLGEEKPYSGKEKDEKTQYRFFVSGDIYYAKTEEKLDKGNFANQNGMPHTESIILFW